MRILALTLIIVLAACATTPAPTTLPTLAVLPTVTARPDSVIVPVNAAERVSPPQIVTREAAYLIVTPTLPPSKTPTQTETPTQTPSFTPTPTLPTTATSTATAYLPPTRVVPFVTAVVAQAANIVCDTNWFFITPAMQSCPSVPPTVSMAVFQEFENGLMIWIQQTDLIYVMYNTLAPAWEIYPDMFDEGMAEEDPDWELPPSQETFQPRRGFGMLWRGNAQVRQRIGWAVEKWEVPYSSTVQEAEDGTIMLQDPYNGVVTLLPNQQDWERYLGTGLGTRLELELIPTLTATPKP
jgi:hypothetical protein